MNQHVLVFGHRGMLGFTVCRHLIENGCEVHTCEQRYEGRVTSELLELVRQTPCTTLINCVGQKDPNTPGFLAANSLLPQHLAAILRADQTLIHASSDCVFDGARGG